MITETIKAFTGERIIPSAFDKIRQDFQYLKDNDISVLYEDRRGKVIASIVLDLDYIGTHFTTGYVTYKHRVDGPERIPYTIHYADVLCISPSGIDMDNGIGLQDYVDVGMLVGIRIIPKGAKPDWISVKSVTETNT